MYMYIHFFMWKIDSGKINVQNVLSYIVISCPCREWSSFKVLCQEKNSFITASSPWFVTSVENKMKIKLEVT